MTIDSDKILHDLLNSLDSLEGIRPGEIPNIALYMDQVTTFMDAQLASSRRFESDKVLTKTMINNYAKNTRRIPLERGCIKNTTFRNICYRCKSWFRLILLTQNSIAELVYY